MNHPSQHAAGFTLIETMIAVAVVAIGASLALPSFDGPMCKARRADALVALMQVQAAQERFRSNGTRYGSLAEIGLPARSTSGHYTLQVAAFDESGFQVLAVATGAQARDTACKHLQLAVRGANVAQASGPDASVANAAPSNRLCWSL